MDTTPNRSHLKVAITNLTHHATLTSGLIDCIEYLAISGNSDAVHHITNLVIVVSERQSELVEIMEDFEL